MSVGEISRGYRVSPHIMVKVVQLLTEQELIAGRNGGLHLNKSPAEVSVGRLIWRAELGWDLVECFDATRNTARSTVSADSKGRRSARNAFLEVLDDHTLADFFLARRR